jgi:hypothetical protein
MIIVLNQLGESPVSKYESVEYNKADKRKYEEMFHYYKSKGVLVNKNFEDKRWIAITGVDRLSFGFDFSEIQFIKMKTMDKISSEFDYSDLVLSMKGYILHQMDFYSSISFRMFVYAFKILLNEGVLIYSNFPETSRKGLILSKYKLIREYFLFIEPYFYNNELMEDLEIKYIEHCRERNRKARDGEDKRALPSVETMFKFNDIIQYFINTTVGSDEKRKKLRERFFPIILWWKITSVLPSRTQEFSVIPKAYKIEKDGITYLRYYRNDIKGPKKINFDHSFECCFREDKFPINQEMKGLIQEYLNLVQHYDDVEDFYGDGRKGPIEREFLLSFRSYKKMSMTYNPHIINDREFLSKSKIACLLSSFLIDYVVGELGIEIIPKSKDFNERELLGNQLNDIALMDTRHYAIMNMIFMGYEHSTVQRVVGHKTVRQSYTYFNHPEQFIRCYIISAAKEKAFEKNSDQKKTILNMYFDNLFGKDGSGNERFRIFKSKQNDNTSKYKELATGKCLYQYNDLLPCKLCLGKHERCRFFVPNKEEISSVVKEFDVITDEISAEIKTINFLMSNIKTLTGFREQFNVSMNKIRSKMVNQSEMIADYIICGMESET